MKKKNKNKNIIYTNVWVNQENIFIGLLTDLVNGSNHTKRISLSNQKCMIQPTLINLNPNEYSQELNYYPLVVILDRCVGSCNTVNDLSVIKPKI